jgi:hypothetical protein
VGLDECACQGCVAAGGGEDVDPVDEEAVVAEEAGPEGGSEHPHLDGQGIASLKLLGDYADAAPPGFLMARPCEGHPTDLAELHGRRVIVCSEVKHGDKFDEARVRLLTGGDRIKARRMRQDFFSFAPPHTNSGYWATTGPKSAPTASRSGGACA